MNIYVRLGKITFSRDFVDTLRGNGIMLTRRNHFRKSGIVINHGNTQPVTVSKDVKRLYLINKPDAIHYCSNKMDNYKILRDFYPMSCLALSDVDDFPVVAKPLGGHHGYGIRKFNNLLDLSNFIKSTSKTYLIQKYIPIKHEFRFNVLDRDVFQVSHKQRLYNPDGTPMKTNKGGMMFSYRSLASKDSSMISRKLWDYIYNVIDTLHDAIGYDLGDYCIDVMKGDGRGYHLSEINSAYGIGQFTLEKLIEAINHKYKKGELEPYRMR